MCTPRPPLPAVERAITIHQPFASAIVAGRKTVENRCWEPPSWAVGSWLAIHASAKRDHPLWPDFAHLWPERPAVLPRSCIVGFARLVSVWAPGEAMDDPWAIQGCYAWEWGPVVAIPEPIPCKGALGLWRLPPEVRALLG